ncbi:hypothetical protein AB1N83_010866 [Pleurotus pulmonarius]|nr:hypothetical protein EYR36_003864 [Pleurotus pulmonarius]
MAPRDKVNPDQKEFLMKHMNDFLEAQKMGRLDKFYVLLYGEWFQKWPTTEDMTIEDESKRKEALGAVVLALKSYLRRWFYNHNKPKRVLPFGHIVKKALQGKKSKRRPQLTEVYCRLFYKDRILQHIKAEVNRLTLKGKKPTRGVKLRLIRNYALALLDLEAPEIKDKVEKQYQRYKEEVEEIQKEATTTPQAYAEAIETIGAYFNAFSQALGEITGWRFTLLAGGPNPVNGGRIRTIAVHHGENHAGLSFGEAMPDARSAMGTAFGSFLRGVYTPSECAARSLYPEDAVQGVASPSAQSDTADTPSIDLPPPIAVGDANLQAAVLSLMTTRDEPTSDTTLDPTASCLNQDFEPLNEDEIDWDSMRLFDPRNFHEEGEGMLGSEEMLGGGSGLSLTDELAAPLSNDMLHSFGFVAPNRDAATYLGAIVSGQASAGPQAAAPSASATVNPPQPAAPSAAVSSQISTDANQATAPVVSSQASADANQAAAPSASATVNLPQPAAPDAAVSSQISADANQANAPGASATVDPPQPAAPSVAISSQAGATAGSVLSKSANAPPKRNKRSRDPIDTALIVPGKRCRKAKDRADAEVKPAKPRAKENRPTR